MLHYGHENMAKIKIYQAETLTTSWKTKATLYMYK